MDEPKQPRWNPWPGARANKIKKWSRWVAELRESDFQVTAPPEVTSSGYWTAG